MKKEVSLKELSNFVKEFLNDLQTSNVCKNVIGLYGNLGAGKTTFVKEVAKQLGVTSDVTSPTFTLMQEYEISRQPSAVSRQLRKLVHIDLYRIEDTSEIEILKLNEIFDDKNNLVLIEWADKLESKTQDSSLMTKLIFNYKDEESRIIEIQNG